MTKKRVKTVTYVCAACGERMEYNGELPEYRLNHRREGSPGCTGALVLDSPQLKATEAGLQKLVDAMVEVLAECGTNRDNPDTCGVCGRHFAECEDERSSHDDPPFLPENMFFSCPGARARKLPTDF